MYFLNKIYFFHLFSISFLFLSMELLILTSANHLPPLNWSHKKMQNTSLLNSVKNVSFYESLTLKLENMLLQQMVEQEEASNENNADNINGNFLN